MTVTGQPGINARRAFGAAALNAIAAAIASVTGLAIVLIAGQTMDPDGYASFASIWGLVFGCAAVLGAVEQENARVRAVDPGPLDRTQLTAALVVGLGAAAALAVLVSVFFDALHLETALVATLVVSSGLVWPVLFLARGYLAGSLRFGSLAAVTAGESILRLAVVILGLWIGLATTPVFAVAALLGGLVGVPVVLRHSVWHRGAQGLGAALRRTGTLMAGAAMSAALITGAPVLVTLASAELPPADVGRLQAAVVVSRFPLIALMVVQGMLVPVFARRRSLYAGRDLQRLLLLVLLVPPVSAVAALLLGDPFLGLLYGADYRVGSVEMMLLTTGATAMGCIQVLVALAVSGDRHRLAPLAYACSLAVTVLLCFTPALAPELRVPVAFSVGPLVGLVVSLAAVLWWRRASAASASPLG